MASRGINKVILIGNLGADPETRFMPNGNAVADVSLATSDTWKDRHTGEKRERTEWHRVVFFGKLAEIVGQYQKKGSKVYVEGRLQTRKWQGQDGQDRYTTEVIVDQGGTLQMLDGHPAGRGQGGGYGRAQGQPQGPESTEAQMYRESSGSRAGRPPPPAQPVPDDGFDDDIPF